MFIAIKTDDGRIKGKISFYCKALYVSRQAFNKYLKTKDAPWKYQALADAMLDICKEDECNDTYGRIRMYQALQLRQPEGVHIPGARTVYRVMEETGLNHKPKRKPNASSPCFIYNTRYCLSRAGEKSACENSFNCLIQHLD